MWRYRITITDGTIIHEPSYCDTTCGLSLLGNGKCYELAGDEPNWCWAVKHRTDKIVMVTSRDSNIIMTPTVMNCWKCLGHSPLQNILFLALFALTKYYAHLLFSLFRQVWVNDAVFTKYLCFFLFVIVSRALVFLCKILSHIVLVVCPTFEYCHIHCLLVPTAGLVTLPLNQYHQQNADC